MMLIVRDAVTGQALSTVPHSAYKSLKTTTTAEAGFETLTVQVDATRFSALTWQGHEVLFIGTDGIYWEGVIEQIQRAEGFYNIFAVGMQLWELAAQSLNGVYYDNRPSAWKDTIENPAAQYIKEGFETKHEDGSLGLGIHKGQVTPLNNTFGLEYLSPSADGSIHGRLNWLSFTYQRLSVPTATAGDYTFQVRGYDGTVDTTLLSVVLNAVDAAPVPQVITSIPGYDALRFVLVKTTAAGEATSDADTYVQIMQPEVSLFNTRPTIKLVVEDILSRGASKIHLHNLVEFTDDSIVEPTILDDTQGAGQSALKQVIDQLRVATGLQWFFGTYEGYTFHLHSVPRYTWSITAKDAGQDAVFSAERGQPAIGGSDIGPITHVRARYVDTDGVQRYTADIPTGVVLPRSRYETIVASSPFTAVAEATARAALHAQRVQQGSFVVKDTVRSVQGWSRNAASVRAGDWVSVDTLSIGTTKVTSGRGGLVGKTTYNGDTNEVTIELFGSGR